MPDAKEEPEAVVVVAVGASGAGMVVVVVVSCAGMLVAEMLMENEAEAFRALEMVGIPSGWRQGRGCLAATGDSKIWVDVALWRKHNSEQLLFFGAVGLREDVAQNVMLRGQLATSIHLIPL